MNLTPRLKILSAQERKITAEVIQLLLEVEQTGEHLDMGYASIFDYCVKELGYSEGSAARRVHAMRLFRSTPEVVKKIETGDLTLTNAAKLNTVLTQAKAKGINLPKQEMLEAALGTSTRAAERKMEATAAKHGFEMKTEDLPLKAKLAKLRALLSHKHPNLTDDALLHLLADEALAKLDPANKKNSGAGVSEERRVPNNLKRAVYVRDQGRCQYRDPVTNRQCTATHFLEYDHIYPHARGGLTKLSNLQLLCRAHNQRKAVRITPVAPGAVAYQTPEPATPRPR